MRFDGSVEGQVGSAARQECEGPIRAASDKRAAYEVAAALRRQLELLLFGVGCFECSRMAAIPQGAFAAIQIRKNYELSHAAKFEEDKQDKKNTGFNAKVIQEGRELTPLKYNSKLMNSIWGLYNRYSVHNFKKIDANEAGLLAGAWGAALAPAEAAVPAAAERIIGASRAGH